MICGSIPVRKCGWYRDPVDLNLHTLAIKEAEAKIDTPIEEVEADRQPALF